MQAYINSPLFRSLASAFAGFIAYGAWAFYANYEHGMGEGAKSAIVQGSFSFTITLVLNSIMEFLYAKLSNSPNPRLITAFIACITLYSASYGINYIAGTMNIIKTILPGAIFSTFYIVGYVNTIAKLAGGTALKSNQ